MTHPSAPIGTDDQANLEIARGKTPIPKFDFKAKDHVELGKSLDLIDFEAGARVSGAGFYFLKNEAVLLELALQQFAIQTLIRRNFIPVTTPDVASTSILHGIGFIPRGPETQIYSIENTELNLVATAEITLGGMYSDQTFEAEQLPLKLVGISHCFRTEAGAAGRASKGLYRVHQFTKIEMFAFTLPDQSERYARRTCDRLNANFSTRWKFPIALSIRRPEIWADPLTASTTSKHGCQVVATMANGAKSPARRTAPTIKLVD